MWGIFRKGPLTSILSLPCSEQGSLKNSRRNHSDILPIGSKMEKQKSRKNCTPEMSDKYSGESGQYKKAEVAKKMKTKLKKKGKGP